MKKSERIHTPTPEYNYMVCMGWVVILKENRPVNFLADSGCLSCIIEYFYVDQEFAEFCKTRRDWDITLIINEYLNN